MEYKSKAEAQQAANLANMGTDWNHYEIVPESGGYVVKLAKVTNSTQQQKRSGRKQDWSIGEIVKIGFVSGLQVIKKNLDGSYDLIRRDSKGLSINYTFQPHHGLQRA